MGGGAYDFHSPTLAVPVPVHPQLYLRLLPAQRTAVALDTIMKPWRYLRHDLFKLRRAITACGYALVWVCIYVLPIMAVTSALLGRLWPLYIACGVVSLLWFSIVASDLLADYINRKDMQ